MEKKRHIENSIYAIVNYVVMSMLKKSIWEKKDHLEDFILALKIMV